MTLYSDAQEAKQDETDCAHKWGPALGSTMVGGMVDYVCVECQAHGWRKTEAPEDSVKWCCGGLSNGD